MSDFKEEFKKKERMERVSFREYPSTINEIKKIISKNPYKITLSEFIQISIRQSLKDIKK